MTKTEDKRRSDTRDRKRAQRQREREAADNFARELSSLVYPFLANVELKNITALENTKNLVELFIKILDCEYFSKAASEGANG